MNTHTVAEFRLGNPRKVKMEETASFIVDGPGMDLGRN